MQKTALLILTFSISTAIAQTVTPVTDNANNGQLKRMVFQEWSDWKPKGATGLIYWKLLHHKYYKGEDSRPYRAGGTFEQNYASLTLQEQDDSHIADSMQQVAQSSITTYLNMSGGEADIAWSTYFGKQFQQLLNEVPQKLLSTAVKYPIAVNKLMENKHYKAYAEYLDITKDRLQVIHNSFADKGDRMVAYLEIQKQLRYKNDVMLAMLQDYIRLTKLPTVEQVNEAKNNTKVYDKDREIVQHILNTWNY